MGIRHFSLNIILVAGLFLCVAPLAAQDTSTSTSDVDFSKATDRQFNESQSFFKQCLKNDTLNMAHDCRCLSAEFLSVRMRLGNDTPRSSIMDAIRGTCLRDPDTPLPESGKKTGLSDYSDAELEEAQLVYNDCAQAWSMYTYYDCKCLAARFLDKRHELGPLASSGKIRLILRDECRNDVGIAGYKYTNCMKNTFGIPKTVKPKEFCECYAQDYTRLYMKHEGKLSEQAKYSFDTRATGNCREKLTGRRF